MGGRENLAVLLMFVVVVLLLRGGTAAEYTVGDSFGWGVPRNNDSDFYQRWTSDKTFRAGDSFVFNWTGTHTVSQRTKEQYDACDKTRGIDVVTSGLRLTLERNGTYYYICRIEDHCEQGQKITLVIGDGINDENHDNDKGSAISAFAKPLLTVALSALIFCFLSY